MTIESHYVPHPTVRWRLTARMAYCPCAF